MAKFSQVFATPQVLASVKFAKEDVEQGLQG